MKALLPQTGISAALEGQDFEKLDFDRSRSSPSAWALELARPRGVGVHIEVTVDPFVLREGESYRARVRSDEAVTLVVIIEEDGDICRQGRLD